MNIDPLHLAQHAALTRAVPYLDRMPKTVAAEIRAALEMYEARVQRQPGQPAKPPVEPCKACEGA